MSPSIRAEPGTYELKGAEAKGIAGTFVPLLEPGIALSIIIRPEESLLFVKLRMLKVF